MMYDIKKEFLVDTDDKKKALLIRIGIYNITQAIPRSAATLMEMGHNITILAMDTSGDKPATENVNGWNVIWFDHQYKPGSKLSFFWAWLCWWVWVIKHIRKGEYDLVQASNLESIVPCVIAKIFRKFGLVFDVRDLWGTTQENPRNFLMLFFRMMERWGAVHVDGMVLSQGLVEKTGGYFGKKVCSRTAVVQVLNVPGEDIRDDYDRPSLSPIKLNFSGHISYVRNAQAVIDLAKAIPNVQIDIVGEVRDKELLSKLLSIDNIKLYGRVPYHRAMELLQEANLIAVMYDVRTLLAVISSANKMFEAMMMSRPYIGSKGAYPGIIAEKYDVGWAIPYGDSQALINLISDLQENPKQIEEKAQKARKVYIENFTWEKQKTNLAVMYRYVMGDIHINFGKRAGWSKVLGSFQSV